MKKTTLLTIFMTLSFLFIGYLAISKKLPYPLAGGIIGIIGAVYLFFYPFLFKAENPETPSWPGPQILMLILSISILFVGISGIMEFYDRRNFAKIFENSSSFLFDFAIIVAIYIIYKGIREWKRTKKGE